MRPPSTTKSWAWLASRMSSGLESRAEAAKRANLAGLLFCFLSILSVCLTVFNLYLFYWIWTSLSANSSSSGSVSSNPSGSSGQVRDQDSALPVQLNLFDQLELLRAENKLTFRGQLLAKKPVQASKIKQINEGATLRLSSASEVQFKISDVAASRPDLVVSAKRESLEFPEGFKVKSRNEWSQPSIECRPNQRATGAPYCHLHATQLELSRPEGVDFGALKSIETGHLRTRRVHSALNKLQLMTGSGEISFESHSDQIHLRALDSISLGSRNSTVIIKAKTIKLGDLVEISHAGKLDELGKQHKLCVCLREKEEEEEEQEREHAQEETNNRQGGDREATGRANNGLVFAIQSHLRCAQFTAIKCKGKR